MAPGKQNVGDLERLGCLLLGGFLLLKGVVTRRASRVVLGGLFACRGLSGFCCGYEALGIDTRSTEQKP